VQRLAIPALQCSKFSIEINFSALFLWTIQGVMQTIRGRLMSFFS